MVAVIITHILWWFCSYLCWNYQV